MNSGAGTSTTSGSTTGPIDSQVNSNNSAGTGASTGSSNEQQYEIARQTRTKEEKPRYGAGCFRL